MNEELKEKNYLLFKQKMEKYGVEANTIDGFFGDKLKNATFLMVKENGDAVYDGALLHVVLRTLTPYAIKLNGLLPENIQVNQDSLVKVCLLHQISKAVMFEPNDDEWQKEKRGCLYKYSKTDASLRMGMRSVFIAQELGIKFTEVEMEAMTILDRQFDDKQSNFYSSPLSTILRQAAELTYLTLKNTK